MVPPNPHPTSSTSWRSRTSASRHIASVIASAADRYDASDASAPSPSA